MKKLLSIALCMLFTATAWGYTTKNSTISANEEWTAGTYFLGASFSIADNITVTVDAGCVIKVTDSTRLTISGLFDCNGTEANPVIFTSEDDDNYGETIVSSDGYASANIDFSFVNGGGFDCTYTYFYYQDQWLGYYGASTWTLSHCRIWKSGYNNKIQSSGSYDLDIDVQDCVFMSNLLTLGFMQPGTGVTYKNNVARNESTAQTDITVAGSGGAVDSFVCENNIWCGVGTCRFGGPDTGSITIKNAIVAPENGYVYFLAGTVTCDQVTFDPANYDVRSNNAGAAVTLINCVSTVALNQASGAMSSTYTLAPEWASATTGTGDHVGRPMFVPPSSTSALANITPYMCYLLDPSDSRAVDGGSDTAANQGMDTLTTDPDMTTTDTGTVDMGFHYNVQEASSIVGYFSME